MIQVNRYTLANGLRIVHNEDDSTQMVALNLLYDVGARDEDPSHTGFAHLFEHLMFGGSLHIPRLRHSRAECRRREQCLDQQRHYKLLHHPAAPERGNGILAGKRPHVQSGFQPEESGGAAPGGD